MTVQEEYVCPACQSTIIDGDLMRCPHCYHFFGPQRKAVQRLPVEAAVPGRLNGLRSVIKIFRLGRSPQTKDSAAP
jgi:hypothetical protein